MSIDIDRLEEIVNGLLIESEQMRAEITAINNRMQKTTMAIDNIRDTLRDMVHSNSVTRSKS